MIKKDDVFIMAVFHMKTAGDSSDSYKTKLFINMDSWVVCCNNGVELHKLKAKFCGFFKGMCNDGFADVFSAAIGFYSIARVCNMAASSDVVRMKNIKSNNFVGF